MEEGIFWKTGYSGKVATELTAQETALRDQFVKEYLFDYSRRNAAIRCGFVEPYATEYAEKFMNEPYVLQKIAELQSQPLNEEDNSGRNDLMRRRIEEGFIRQANYSGPGASHGARVAALSKLANFYGMDKATKIEQEITHRGGVMAIPGIASLGDWEEQAVKSQTALTGAKEK